MTGKVVLLPIETTKREQNQDVMAWHARIAMQIVCTQLPEKAVDAVKVYEEIGRLLGVS